MSKRTRGFDWNTPAARTWAARTAEHMGATGYREVWRYFTIFEFGPTEWLEFRRVQDDYHLDALRPVREALTHPEARSVGDSRMDQETGCEVILWQLDPADLRRDPAHA